MASGTVTASTEILNSWKEIAVYLNRGVRTVQRWEADLQMPVRRPRGRSRSAVIAMRSEIDLWLKSSPIGTSSQALPATHPGGATAPAEFMQLTTNELLLSSRKLRVEVSHSRVQLHAAVADLTAMVQKMMQNPALESFPKAAPSAVAIAARR